MVQVRSAGPLSRLQVGDDVRDGFAAAGGQRKRGERKGEAVTTLEHPQQRLRVLVVDDEADVRLGLRLLIESSGAQVQDASSGEQALETLAGWTPHVGLLDLAMGAVSGMDVLRYLREQRPEVKVLVITGYGTVELAVEAMRLGAVNFLVKPFDNAEILAEVERYGREALIAEGIRRMRAAHVEGPAAVIAEDLRMTAVLEQVRQVGPTTMPVLIRGESGTGKELVARMIHQHSRDPSLPFLALNSAALPDTLLESELFGHVKGAFTGADRGRQGIFAQARGGTVFLDEIALMSLAFQGKLLRVLQEHMVIPLGSSKTTPVDFRLLASTNRGLRQRIGDGLFREDLYYRLNVVPITVPPLRERPADVVPLAAHFVARYASEAGFAPGRFPSLTAGALDALQGHLWPGNVRELESCIQRALIRCQGEKIRAQHLELGTESGSWSDGISESLSYEEGKQRALEDYRRRIVKRCLRATRGNVTRAAEMCGLTRAAFQRNMRSLGIDRRQFRSEVD